MKMTKHLIASIKRKDIKEITACILESEGLEAEAKGMRDGTRFTVALVDRNCIATDLEESEKVVPEQDEPSEEEIKHTPIDGGDKKGESTESPDGFDDVRKAIKKGKGKKAIKLVKAHKENGSRGSVLSNLLKEAKDL